MILNIETSSKICSVALCKEGEIYLNLVSDSDMEHSTKLAPFVEQCLSELSKRGEKLDAVAVSMGPGSYTGLRIGLSLAKGVCFGLDIPLIGIPTLEILAVKAMFSSFDLPEDVIFVPMIDARRMEVYTCAYDIRLNEVLLAEALILTEESYKDLEGRPLVMIGDATPKAKSVLTVPVLKWIDKMPLASDMTALSEKAFRNKQFIDIAYSTPLYLKNFQATTPKKNIIC